MICTDMQWLNIYCITVLDKDTDSGYDPGYVAWRIGEAMAIGEDEVVIAPLLHRYTHD